MKIWFKLFSAEKKFVHQQFGEKIFKNQTINLMGFDTIGINLVD